MKKKLYIICNSHLDPIWLWNRTSGRSSWLNTMHSVVRIMEEQPEFEIQLFRSGTLPLCGSCTICSEI
ncbi:MAG: hypothetical protein E7040_07760 [Lentisphaerae bacterium]|nr:hypothetical protein [Lentisphaerota bacterium]